MTGYSTRRHAWFAASLLVGTLTLTAGRAQAANTCNGLLTIDYVSGSSYSVPGDIVRVRLTLGTGSIQGGTKLTVNRVRFELDCNSAFALGLPCTDEGAKIEYQGDGTISTTCGTIFSTGHGISSAPNQVVFTPNVPIVIPPNQSIPPGFCDLEFDVKVLAQSADPTPNLIEQVAGFLVPPGDASCDNGLPSSASQTSSIPLCPTCNDNNACTGDTCNQNTGQCVFTPLPDSTPCADTDGNACTTAGCNGFGTCDQDHVSVVCTPDASDCTADPPCNPLTGLCDHPALPASTPCPDTDGNACTTAGCTGSVGGAFLGCDQNHLVTVCSPDSNDCTSDPPCNPTTGLCTHPPLPPSTPCPDTDGNLCTQAGCDAGGVCDQLHLSTVCAPDTNDCTNDPACNPATGLCLHPPVANSTPCADTDGNACTTAGCEAGTCVQSHQTVSCPSDGNLCTNDVCNPSSGLCENPPVPDSTPCPDTDNDVCTIAGCEAGTCVQSHVNCTSPPLRHFQCYEIRKDTWVNQSITMVDPFRTSTVSVHRPDRLCAPANKLNEDPLAPTDPQHLMHYKAATTAPGPFTRLFAQTLVDQFHPTGFLVDVIKPDRIMVPAAKSFAAQPAPLVDPTLDHFNCYKIRLTRDTPRFNRVLLNPVTDQIGTFSEELIRPIRLCAPANKNNENPGAETHQNYLTCYKTRAAGLSLHPWVTDQFAARQWELIHRRELCVPSQFNPQTPPPTTTSTTTTSTTTTPSTTSVPVCASARLDCTCEGGTLVAGCGALSCAGPPVACADQRPNCVANCAINGFGPGECATKPCTDACNGGQPCQ